MNYQIDYRDPVSLRVLADWLHAVPPHNETLMAAFLVDQDLMRPQSWVRFLFWLIRRRHRTTALAWQMLEKRSPGTSRALIERTAEWATDGKDSTTKDAAGGFNPTEIRLLTAGLRLIGHVPIP